MWFVATALSMAMASAFFITSFLYYNQEDILYVPELEREGLHRHNALNPKSMQSPEEHDIPFEEFQIPTDEEVKVHAWLLLQKHSIEKPTIIFFHGNAGNIGIRLPNAKEMYNRLDANILMVEYRAFGDSDDNGARPTEQGMKRDAQSVYEFITQHPIVDPNQIFLFGRSLGGAEAFHLAGWVQDQQQEEEELQLRQRKQEELKQKELEQELLQQQQQEKLLPPLAGVIVENTFFSIPRMVDEIFPRFMSQFKGLVLRMEWDNGAIASRLKTPILYLAGFEDDIVPHDQMLALFEESEQASQCHRIYIVQNGTHNLTWKQGGESYWENIRSFLRDVVRHKNC